MKRGEGGGRLKDVELGRKGEEEGKSLDSPIKNDPLFLFFLTILSRAANLSFAKMANFLLLILFLLLLSPLELLAVEQTLIIDFDRPHSSAQPRSGDYPPDGGFGNALTIEKGTRVRQSRGDGLPSSIQELKELIRNMDRAFARRFEQLSKRLDWLEANQHNFRHAAMADWSAFSVDKRIRMFSHAKSGWSEAEGVCRAHSGQLLQIDSDHENRRITEFLKGTEGLYWIGAQTTLHFNLTSMAAAGNYSNFADGTELGGQWQKGEEGNLLEDHPVRRCAAISARTQGRWLNRECAEKLGFICQI